MTGVVLWVFNCTYILYLAGVTPIETYTAIVKQITKSIPYALIPVIVWYISHSSVAFVLAGIGTGIIFLLVQLYHIKKKEN